MQYLNEIREAWADCKPITRTGPASDKPVTMLIKNSAGLSTEICWTDMLGETFERQWTERACSVAYRSLVEDAVGILLFVHPHKVHEAPLISEAQASVRAVQGGGISTREEDKPQVAEKPAPYKAAKVPTQVQLVELLQFVDARSVSEPIRISVIVSAWDLIAKTMPNARPDSWCEHRLPLLYQFLLMRDDRFQANFFGVSAQGDDYSNVSELRQRHRSASDRIRIVQGNDTSSDITRPVRWALGEAL
jgi:hypothetical protein